MDQNAFSEIKTLLELSIFNKSRNTAEPLFQNHPIQEKQKYSKKTGGPLLKYDGTASKSAVLKGGVSLIRVESTKGNNSA